MTRLAFVGVAVTAALALSAPAAAAADPLQVQTSISPSFPVFGDAVTARVDVVVDRNKVDPKSVQVDGSFGQWQQEGNALTSTASSGPTVKRSWRYKLSCLDPTCLPGAEPLAVQFPPATVTARSAAGGPLTTQGEWPPFSVTARIRPPSASHAPFELDTALPAATYRVSPSSLALALYAFAALLAVAGVALIAPELARRQRHRRAAGDDRSPLARALAYVREAQGRPTEDRRRAVGLLARTLRKEGNGLDAEASSVAWSESEPSPPRMEELARAVEANHSEGA